MSNRIVYSEFLTPKKAIKRDISINESEFILEPLEKGFGHIVGNVYRRILLSFIEAPAIIGFRLEGCQHEFMSTEGIVEDLVNIVLNLKSVAVKTVSDCVIENIDNKIFHSRVKIEITKEDIEEGEGFCVLRARDILNHEDLEVANPDLPICTFTKPQTRSLELIVKIGRGYEMVEDIIDNEIGLITLDANYSVVTNVSYDVELTRVGSKHDYDRLVLKITTDGRLSPREALDAATSLGSLVFNKIKENSDEVFNVSLGNTSNRDTSTEDNLIDKLSILVDEIELSVRAVNCLKEVGIEFIGELVVKSENDLMKFKNFGRKSLSEIRRELEKHDLKLGSPEFLFGLGIDYQNISEEEIRDKIKELKARRNLSDKGEN